MKKKKSKWIWAVVVLAVAVMVSVPLLGGNTPAHTSETVQSRTIETWYTFTGTVQSRNTETVTARKTLEVAEVLVDGNATVKQGEVLFITAEDEEVTAPFDGTVQALYVEEADIVAAGAPLYELVDFGNLEVALYISEYDLDRVQEGDTIDIQVAAANLTFEAEIEAISTIAQQRGGSMYFVAIAGIENNSSLRIGMTAEAGMLKAAEYNAPTISLAMLQYDEHGAPYVEILNDKNNFERRGIQLGISDGVYVSVKSGLAVGDEIVLPDKQAGGGLADSLIPGMPG